MTLRSYDATYDVFLGLRSYDFGKFVQLCVKQNHRAYGDRESVQNCTIVICHPREIVRLDFRLEGYDQFTVTYDDCRPNVNGA